MKLRIYLATAAFIIIVATSFSAGRYTAPIGTIELGDKSALTNATLRNVQVIVSGSGSYLEDNVFDFDRRWVESAGPIIWVKGNDNHIRGAKFENYQSYFDEYIMRYEFTCADLGGKRYKYCSDMPAAPSNAPEADQ